MITPLLALALALTAAPAQAAGPFNIKEAVNCRTGPGRSYDIVKQYSAGDQVTLECQTEGENINDDTIWDKTTDGCFTSDYYVQTTGRAEYVAPKCDAPSTPTAEPCPTLNEAGTALLKEFEGFVPAPAPDPIGLPTVGYGHLCQTEGCSEVPYPFPLTEETATQLLNDDVPRYTSCLGDMLGSVTLNDNQWAALASWVYNMGCGQTADSTLISRINAGEDMATVVGQELPEWVHAGGEVLPGLVRRRDAEVALFNTPSGKEAYPTCA
ncbi:hypothetical protein CcaverHIS002_0106040 [Cutaneotrichosporon cavernicola]|uniref:Lysozyme n=1 Tax=Cutaneotrichosporon cavernicola TaxID=279322 RepID=A0AA48I4T4_9TREE|nr:uncharacterized protein CcaverHIS019_0105980 [Cutaneotrichosporon cavernicola]BEI80075.1 hypothetical protein CcaverHIS002_0106040 [Cutaneotrichosporon cavernicola]BEI87880.1 hypothetical protein CcaverHIS019_0105980 [Cutaneotrichosporon cavernicola]BEI95654.1 hypothetical protein CcaverHIS631_0106030 [Cutaneotrichosporon cavernicola]BEJ03428.1 hypothetical protein CcaverHIS641_0106030 [Cutaneotrichosporon cavernicola]